MKEQKGHLQFITINGTHVRIWFGKKDWDFNDLPKLQTIIEWAEFDLIKNP